MTGRSFRIGGLMGSVFLRRYGCLVMVRARQLTFHKDGYVGSIGGF
jgi:hypothetical protein